MKERMTIVDRYIKQVDVHLRVNEKKNIVACRYISYNCEAASSRVSCPTIGRLCEPVIHEGENTKTQYIKNEERLRIVRIRVCENMCHRRRYKLRQL